MADLPFPGGEWAPSAIPPGVPTVPTNGAGVAMPDVALPGPPAIRFPVRPRLRVEPQVVVESVRRRAEAILSDTNRTHWMEQRLQRYAKYRGLLDEKTFPWVGCANMHPPILQMSELRVNAGLHNAVMSMRPLISAKATEDVNQPKEETITDTLDTQFFLDPGPELAERRYSDYISLFTQDGNAVFYTPWVKDEQRITRVEHLPPQPGVDPELVLTEFMLKRYGQHGDPVRVEQAAHRYVFEVRGPHQITRDVEIAAYQDEDGAFEFEVTSEETLYDGPVALPIPISALLVPTRCTNLQPPAAWNPTGAPHVGIVWEYRLGEIERLKASGQMNYLDAKGLETLRAHALGGGGPRPDDALEEQKDEAEGRDHVTPTGEIKPEQAHLPVRVYLWFDSWDGEDVLFTVAQDVPVLLDARRLREKWPAVRAYRPFAEACANPVPMRYYGISLLELGEQLYDWIKGTIDQAHDSAAFSTIPTFFYGASSKMPTDRIRVAPGEGIPVPGVPRDTVYIPSWPSRDQTWAFQMVGLAFQWFEKLMSIGGVQQGQVPTGKASALRTVGTTQALLQQGDVRADQLLLRLFGGLRQVARLFHAMNRHFLPPEKQIRRAGWEGERAAYSTVTPDDIDAEVEFDFRPDFLLSNQQMLAQALQQFLTVIATPLAFQLGAVDGPRFFEALKDYGKALKLNWRRYLKPPLENGNPPILAQEAIQMILRDQRPVGPPLEGPEAHLKTFQAFIQSDDFGMLTAPQVELVRAHMGALNVLLQQQASVQAAAQFQQALQSGQGGGVATTAAEPEMAMGLPQQGEGTGVGG